MSLDICVTSHYDRLTFNVFKYINNETLGFINKCVSLFHNSNL